MENNDKKLRFAVASKTGKVVDLHFGHTTEFYIYDYNQGRAEFIEKRDVNKYCDGKESSEDENKFDNILKVLGDCNGVIALRIGNSPTMKLKNKNIDAYMSCDLIEDAVIKAATNANDILKVSVE